MVAFGAAGVSSGGASFAAGASGAEVGTTSHLFVDERLSLFFLRGVPNENAQADMCI